MNHARDSFTDRPVQVRRVGAAPLGLDAQVDAFLHRVAQHEPQEGQHGLMLRYDSSWRALAPRNT